MSTSIPHCVCIQHRHTPAIQRAIEGRSKKSDAKISKHTTACTHTHTYLYCCQERNIIRQQETRGTTEHTQKTRTRTTPTHTCTAVLPSIAASSRGLLPSLLITLTLAPAAISCFTTACCYFGQLVSVTKCDKVTEQGWRPAEVSYSSA